MANRSGGRKKPTFPDMACTRCGVSTPKSSSQQRYCRDCATVVKVELDRRRAALLKMPPTTFQCAICECDVIKRSGSHKYCDECSVRVVRERDRLNQKKVRATEASREKERQRSLIRNADPKMREYRREYERKRRSEDPKFSIQARMRKAVSDCLNGKKAWKSWQLLLGYSIDDLMVHLERQFSRGMSWDNRHKWHIDHIVPVASFDFNCSKSHEFQACWALTNLRPMWAEANRQKSDKLIYLV